MPLLFRLLNFQAAVRRSGSYVLKDGKRITNPKVVLTGDTRLEYLAIIYMIRIVIIYVFGFLTISFLAICTYFWTSEYGSSVLEDQGVNMYWFSIFISVSAFTNGSISLLSDSLMQFQNCPAILLIVAIVILGGLTAFPIALRAIVLTLRKMFPANEVIHYIIHHPRKIYILLFPKKQTLLLLLTVVLLNSVQLVLLELLEFNKALFQGLSPGLKVVNGMFQTVCTRDAGFNSLDISLSIDAIRIMWIVAMYIAAYPVTLSIRTSKIKNRGDNVESSRLIESPARRRQVNNRSVLTRSQSCTVPVNIQTQADQTVFITKKDDSTKLGYQIKSLVLRDVTLLVLAWFIICAIENEKLSESDTIFFTSSKVLFEIVSAFGTVGLSLGYPNTSTSFSGVWTEGSKMVLAVVMLFGRHRGLPESVDRAITGSIHYFFKIQIPLLSDIFRFIN